MVGDDRRNLKTNGMISAAEASNQRTFVMSVILSRAYLNLVIAHN